MTNPFREPSLVGLINKFASPERRTMNHSIGNRGDSIRLIGLHLSMVESMPIHLCTNRAQNATVPFDIFDVHRKSAHEKSRDDRLIRARTVSISEISPCFPTLHVK